MFVRCLVVLIAIGSASVAHAQSITTLFASNNGGASLWTNYFDINVINSNGMTISAYDVNINTAGLGVGFDLDVYVTALGDTHVGNTDVPGAWSLVSTGSGVGGLLPKS